jgi:hypothetical protein
MCSVIIISPSSTISPSSVYGYVSLLHPFLTSGFDENKEIANLKLELEDTRSQLAALVSFSNKQRTLSPVKSEGVDKWLDFYDNMDTVTFQLMTALQVKETILLGKLGKLFPYLKLHYGRFIYNNSISSLIQIKLNPLRNLPLNAPRNPSPQDRPQSIGFAVRLLIWIYQRIWKAYRKGIQLTWTLPIVD